MGRGVIYLPVEIKHREYDAQIFLALSAVARGFTVYVGSHASIYRLLENNDDPIGLILDKSMPNETRLKWLKEKCQQVWVMDAEVSPVHTDSVLEIELMSRVYDYGIKEIDRFLVVGDMASNASKVIFGNYREKIVKSGWPRIDIAGVIGERIYSSEILKIKSKYPNYLLFASSFGDNRDPNETQGQRRAKVYSSTPLWGGEQNSKLIYEKFLYTVECLRVWDQDPRVPTIVVRPHVGEHKSIWKSALRDLNKTFIEDDGSAAPWIHASQGVIHHGSTIAFQAFLAGKENFFFESGALNEYSEVTKKMSQFRVAKDLPPIDVNVRTSKHVNLKFEPRVIKDFIYFPEKGSTSFILDEIEKLNLETGFDISNLKVIASQINLVSIRRALGLIRDELLWKAKRIHIHPQSVSIPGGLGKREISRMLNVFDNKGAFAVKRKTINLWELKLLNRKIEMKE